MAAEPEEWWRWGVASSAQLAAGIIAVRRGLIGSDASMPFKAFLVASLFVSAGATGVVAALQANGMRDLEDWTRMGAEVRSWLGAPSRHRSQDLGERPYRLPKDEMP